MLHKQCAETSTITTLIAKFYCQKYWEDMFSLCPLIIVLKLLTPGTAQLRQITANVVS
jgi:hypothetical protein